MWLKRPVYRGFKCEGRCEGRSSTLTPALTLPSHFRHRKVYCQGLCLQNLTKVPEKYSYLVPTVQHRYTNSIAMLHYQYSYAALSVQGCCTFTGTIIRKSLQWLFCHIAMIYCRYTYAVLSVSLCYTFGTRMLCFSGTVFSICLQAISR